MSWITENVCTFFTEVIGSFIDAYGALINNLFFTFTAAASINTYYVNAQKLFVALGIALVSFMTVKVVMSGYMLETAYDSDEDPFNLLIRIAETTAVVTCSGSIFTYGLQVSKLLCTDLLGATDITGFDGKTRELINAGNAAATSFVPLIIMIVIVFISVIIFTVMSGLRAGELLVMNLFLPIFAIDLLTNSRERWNNFFTGYVFALISYAIQTLFYMIALKNYISASITDQSYMLHALIWMIVAIKSPQVIEKYLYKTGISNAASSGLRMVAQTAIMRTAMR